MSHGCMSHITICRFCKETMMRTMMKSWISRQWHTDCGGEAGRMVRYTCLRMILTGALLQCTCVVACLSHASLSLYRQPQPILTRALTPRHLHPISITLALAPVQGRLLSLFPSSPSLSLPQFVSLCLCLSLSLSLVLGHSLTSSIHETFPFLFSAHFFPFPPCVGNHPGSFTCDGLYTDAHGNVSEFNFERAIRAAIKHYVARQLAKHQFIWSVCVCVYVCVWYVCMCVGETETEQFVWLHCTFRCVRVYAYVCVCLCMCLRLCLRLYSYYSLQYQVCYD